MKDKEAYEMPIPKDAIHIEMEKQAPPATDDFVKIKRELLTPEGKVREVKPAFLDPCPKCKTVHTGEKNPICVCVKCGDVGRIEWCGQCTKCAWEFHALHTNEEYANALFPAYGAWKKGEVERLAKEGMPWEN